jgi:signal transduction histidine kinase
MVFHRLCGAFSAAEVAALEEHARMCALALDKARLIERLTRAEDRQAKNESWLDAVLDLVPVPVLLVELGTARVLLANRAADRIAGGRFPREWGERAEHFPGYDTSGRPLPPERMPIARASRGERLDGLLIDWVTPIGRKCLLIHSDVLPAAYGHTATAVVAFDDVSKLKAVEAQLHAAVRVRDDFLSIASHELKTPLTALRLQAQGLLRVAQTEETQAARRLTVERLHGRLQAIDRNVDRLHALIDKLLSLPRIASGRLDLDREPFDLAELVDDVAQRFADELARAGSSFDTRIDRPVNGAWDRLRLDQVLTNLLANAVKYGRGRPIELTLCAEPARAVIALRDHGIGIAPCDHRRIFERFERAVSDRNYGGFGLGLFIAKYVVEAHGGSIRVESTLGEGATFVVELPRE